MAGYTALIDLRVNGLDGLKKVTDSITSINNLIKQIKPVPTLFDQKNRGGTEAERASVQKAKDALSGLVKAYADGNTRVVTFSTSMAGLSNQIRSFNVVVGNAKVGSENFVNGIVAAERASRKLTNAEYDRLRVLRNIYTAERTGGRTTTTAAQEVLERGRKVLGTDASGLKSSINELELYEAEIKTVFATVSQGTPVFRELQIALAAVNKELNVARGMGAIQGPALPAGFTEQGARSGTFPSSPIRGGVDMKGSPLAREAQRKQLQNVLIGGGFPMLFGGGAGAVLGGAAGGLIPGNPMMSIVTSALGTVVDQFAAAATEMGASLRDPITNFGKLKETNLFASKAQEFYIQKLIETGRITEATGAIQAQIIKKVGVSGYNDLTALGNASSDLSKAWADFNLQLQAAVAGPLAGLLAWLTEVVRLSTSSTQQQAERLDPAAFTKAQMEAISKTSTFGFGGNAAAYNKELDKLSAAIVSKNVAKIKPTKTTESEDLNTIESGIKAAEQQADIIKDAYRTGARLQQQAIDLQRQGTDLQRRVANDIFNKQQEIARLQIDSDRKRQQIAIETVDLEYRRRISNEEGRVAEVLAAEADLMKTRAQGEADIGAAKRNLELDIDKQKRDTENYIYQLNRDIDSIRRAILAYEMDVADYRLKTERQIADERRIQAAANGGGGLLTGDITGQQITKATQDANKFTGIANQCAEAVKSFYNSLGVELPGVTAWADTVRKAGVVMTDFSKIKPGDIVAKGKPGDTSHVGVFTGGDNVFHQSANRGRKAGNFPDLGYFKQGGYFVRPSGMMGQLNDAGSQIQRPAVPTPSVSGVGGTMAALDAKSAGIRKEAVALQEKLNKLQEEAAVTRLQEIARGPIDLQQRKDAVQFAAADLNVVKAVSTEEQERLALEAQSAVKLQIRLDRDKEILDKTKLQGVEREQLVKSLAEGVEITKQQIELDTQLLILAQQTRVEKEAAAIQAQIGVTGTGLQAGFVGAAGSAFESEMLTSGNTEEATRLAELTNQLTLAQVQAQGMESSVLAIGDAFGTAMTSGVASLIDGTATAEQVFAQFLDTIAQALLNAAAKMIATYIAIGIAKIFAGMGGGGGGDNAAAKLGSNPNVAAYSRSAKGSTFANGIATFAKGGTFSNSIVSSPTLFKFADGGTTRTGLMGEAGPEAIMPLKRGSDGSLGVQANGLREAMDRQQGGASGSPVLNMSFQSTSINGVEYVSRDQLESAMAETRRNATRDGAKRGMTMTLDRIQNSSSTRRKVGI